MTLRFLVLLGRKKHEVPASLLAERACTSTRDQNHPDSTSMVR